MMFSLLITLACVFSGLMFSATGYTIADRSSPCSSITSGTYIITSSESKTDVRLDKNLINKGLWLEEDPSNPPDSGMWILTKTSGGFFIRNQLLDANVTSSPFLSGGMRGTEATLFSIKCAGNEVYTVTEAANEGEGLLWTVKPSTAYHIRVGSLIRIDIRYHHDYLWRGSINPNTDSIYAYALVLVRTPYVRAVGNNLRSSHVLISSASTSTIGYTEETNSKQINIIVFIDEVYLDETE